MKLPGIFDMGEFNRQNEKEKPPQLWGESGPALTISGKEGTDPAKSELPGNTPFFMPMSPLPMQSSDTQRIKDLETNTAQPYVPGHDAAKVVVDGDKIPDSSAKTADAARPQGQIAQPQSMMESFPEMFARQNTPLPSLVVAPNAVPQAVPVQPVVQVIPGNSTGEAESLLKPSILTPRHEMPYPASLRPPAAVRQQKPRRSAPMFGTSLVIFLALALAGGGYFFFEDVLDSAGSSLLKWSSGKKIQSVQQIPDSGNSAESAEHGDEYVPQTIVSEPVRNRDVSASAAAQPADIANKTNEEVEKALAIVKGYRLDGGRGTIADWFQNSFVSGSGGGGREEWAATLLDKSVYVVQYRFVRPTITEPVLYQFEVDIDKNQLTRGVNNAAIDLLGPGTKRVAAASETKKSISSQRGIANKKKSVKIPAKKKIKSKRSSILPLPKAPVKRLSKNRISVPSGFEEEVLPGKFLKRIAEEDEADMGEKEEIGEVEKAESEEFDEERF